MSERPSPFDLWQQATDEHGISARRSQRYRELMVEHGHLRPGPATPLPCGWSPSQVADAATYVAELATSAPASPSAAPTDGGASDA